jgi:hypothetical protein
MLDKVTEWLQAFQIFMDHVSAPGSLVAIALATLATPLLIFVHELGHALAVRARGLPLEAMKVGHESDVVLTLGGFRMEFGRLTGKGDVGGYVLYDGRRSTPADVLVIALFEAPRTSHISATTCSPTSARSRTWGCARRCADRPTRCGEPHRDDAWHPPCRLPAGPAQFHPCSTPRHIAAPAARWITPIAWQWSARSPAPRPPSAARRGELNHPPPP